MAKLSVILTERDIALLHLLGRSGVMKPAHAKQVYGGVKRYHIRRIEKLSEAGMIIRDYGFIRPTKKGLKAAGYEGEFVRLLKHQYEDRALAVELLLKLPEWDSSFGIELKRRGMLERRSQVAGVIQHSNMKYALYILSCLPKPGTVTYMRAEQRDLRLWGIERVAVFCTTKKIIESLDLEPPDGIKECCLLPYPAGVNSFKRIFTQDFRTFVNQRFPGVRPCRRPFAHFEWQDKYITIMHNNDLVKRQALIDYLTYAQKRESRQCILVCTPSQAQEIRTLFREYDVELIIDEGTHTEIQKPSATQKTNSYSNPSHHSIHP